MNKENRLEKITVNIIKIMFLILLVVLFLCSVFGNASVNPKEHTQYTNDNFIIHILCIIAISIIATVLVKKNIKINKKVAIITAVIWALCCTAWILMTQFQPRADQKYTMNAALEMRKGNFSALEEGGYLYIHPHQYGLTLYFYAVSFLFNENTFMAVQFINIIGLMVAYYSIYKTMEYINDNKETSKYIIVALLLFAPMAMYITFIYGNIMGLAFSMLAILFEIIYLKGEKKRYILLMALSIGLAVVFKSNYLVTMAAMVVLFMVEAIFRNKIKYIIPIVAIILSYIGGNCAVTCTMRAISHIDKNEGSPSIAYIAMGMQDGYMAPGWYNGYNKKVYVKNQYNNEIASEKSKESIKKSLEEFKEKPQNAVKFYSEKVVSQWNNPTFQSIWIHLGRKTEIKTNRIVKSIIKEKKIGRALVFYMNITQTLILFGAIMYVILEFKKLKIQELIYAIIFIGGFIFHLIWEAKCQYTITYFVLLIPYSVLGYRKLGQHLLKFYNFKVKKLKSHDTKDIIMEAEE